MLQCNMVELGSKIQWWHFSISLNITVFSLNMKDHMHHTHNAVFNLIFFAPGTLTMDKITPFF